MDDAMIKYMLSWESSFGKLTWSGVDFMIMDNEGNVGYCDDFRPKGHSLGNILSGTLRLLPEPGPFPEHGVSDGTVDGVANFLELNYRQLTENNVLSFARQGGVYHTSHGVYYKNLNTDFNDSRTRAKYRFPPRNITDCYHILLCRERSWESRAKQVLQFLLPEIVTSKLSGTASRTFLARRLPLLRHLYRSLRAAL
jgi:hypothetical protein